jgi:hypothetical protein
VLVLFRAVHVHVPATSNDAATCVSKTLQAKQPRDMSTHLGVMGYLEIHSEPKAGTE